MILVTGATGELGKLVIENLLKSISKSEIIALVRSTEKAHDYIDNGINVKIGDYSDITSLDNAMKDVSKVLLISSNDPINRLTHHKNVIDSAKKSGVKEIIFVSGLLVNMESSPLKIPMLALFQTEQYLKDSGLKYTIVQNSLYMENIKKYIGENVLITGINFPTGNGKVAFATRADLAEGIAILCVQESTNKVYPLTGSYAYSFEDVATELSDLSGKKVEFYNVSDEDFLSSLKSAGIPEQVANITLVFKNAIKNNDINVVDHSLENILGRKTTTLRDYLKKAYFNFK